jgi:hypothetical protein
MVEGLARFAQHFCDWQDQYALIGGAACDLAMNVTGETFRATKDLDIVLLLDDKLTEFAQTFWEFVELGGYTNRQSATGRPQFYRFGTPTRAGFPVLIELFSRQPDSLVLQGAGPLTPIPLDDPLSSLSAILLDDQYYHWIQRGRIVIDDVSCVRPEHLLPLKAKAWLDLSARKASGTAIDSKDIKKHRNDVFRLVSVLDPTYLAKLSPTVASDLQMFVEQVRKEPLDLKPFGITALTFDETLELILQKYRE